MRLPKFKLFDYTTPGPGIEKDAPKKKGIALFFDILGQRFWKMVSLNLIYLLFSIPALIIQYFISYALLTLIFAEYMLKDATMASTVSQMATYISVLSFSLFGGGASTAGMTFVMRNYALDTHSWVWSDFFRIFKSKFLKATGIYIVDTIMLTLMGINFWFYGSMAGANILAWILQGLMVVLFLIWLLMHSYIYPILVSYEDQSIFKIYRNSFLLAMGKLPKTALATILSVIISGLVCFLACFVTVYAMLIIPVVLFTFVAFVNLFITLPTMQKYAGEIQVY